jgi:phage anti-repressor protein
MENYEINPIYKDKIAEFDKFILKKKSNVTNEDLTLFLVDREILSYECKKCKNDGIWQGKQLPLILDRLNNNITDNRIENLRFLCPNCYMQTNKKKTLFKKIVKDEQRLCIDCGKRIVNKTTRIENIKCKSLRCKKCLEKALLASQEDSSSKTI